MDLSLNIGKSSADKSRHHVSSSRHEEELSIIQKAKQNHQAFEPLYSRYFEEIFRFVYQRLDDKDLAKDITQQAFIRAMQNISKFEDRGLPFKSWLYRIAYNELNMHFRKNANDRTINVDDEGMENMADELLVDAYEDLYQPLAKLLKDLNQDQLALIEMRFFEKRSFAEIGDILQITENNAKVKLYRLLDKLKERLNKNEGY